MKRLSGDWMSTELIDMLGHPFTVGDKVARACKSGRAVNLEIVAVTKIQDEKLYLDGSKVPVNYPGRFLIVNKLFPQGK